MTRQAYRPDRRTTADLLAALSDVAAATPLPASLGGAGGLPPQTWADLLFAGDRLASEAEPSQALLRALAQLHEGLVDHADLLPDLARAWLVAERLGVPRLPVVPDRAVVVVDGDPKRTPVELPRGSLLKAGKGPLGERLYATAEAVTVLGAPVLGAHSHRILESGFDVAVHRRAGLSDGSAPSFAPFGDATDPAAPHELYVASELLRFSRGTLVVTLTFDGVTADGPSPASLGAIAAALRGLLWEVSTAERRAGASANVSVLGSGIRVMLSLTGGSAPLPVDGAPQYFVRAAFPPPGTAGFDRETALRFAFRTLRLKVQGIDVPPDAAYAGDGLLDATKEFEPFGPVPRRGDSFYLQLDEAFGKALTRVSVTLHRIDSAQTVRPAVYGAQQSTQWAAYANALLKGQGVTYAFAPSDFARPDFALGWERFDGVRWNRFQGPATTFGSFTQPIGGTPPRPFSAPTEIGGAAGHFVRAFLFHGDFGWADFQQTIAENAAHVAKGDRTRVVPAVPPDPPVLSRVSIGYESEEVSTASGLLGLYARNGLSSAAALAPAGAGGAFHPFRQDEDGYAGAFFLGVGDPLPRGEVVTVFASVDEADACAAGLGRAPVLWEYRTEAGSWRGLPCVDGTLGLRQSGVLRFVAPLDWDAGAPEADETAGRWLRARSPAPSAAGRVLLLRTDAVEAVYRLAPGREADDPTPSAPIPAGAITALRAPVPGVKKVGNPAPSWGGRGPEPDAAYFARSGGVLRHRGRAITPWDVERLIASAFSELALVRCLRHHSAAGTEEAECAAGWLAVVPVPDSEDRTPAPSVQLAAAIEAYVVERGAVGLRVAVLCPLYAEVGVRATLHLVPGAPAAAREEIEARLRRFLHPLSRERAADFGEPLYRSEVVRFLEEQAAVDHVSDVGFLAPHARLERVDVDACRGLVASAAVQELFAEAAL